MVKMSALTIIYVLNSDSNESVQVIIIIGIPCPNLVFVVTEISME